ncbi:hypothetical protein K402DRAFT_258778 [Aulographum hederae CBS 113979]|uniref:Secreted protein n=1 Tax=Aulographum hederae CBS 113979 TaxID=1176131 RepID=A0A6G1H9D1_9PEZI|nr:hypothetical protein K402DRAFT_258778 [Aulographum hederae CBS 113979]
MSLMGVCLAVGFAEGDAACVAAASCCVLLHRARPVTGTDWVLHSYPTPEQDWQAFARHEAQEGPQIIVAGLSRVRPRSEGGRGSGSGYGGWDGSDRGAAPKCYLLSTVSVCFPNPPSAP